ncbi:MAG: DNA helicase, partial [Anaerolineae bacterium]|nr:DNA helicase [Anaerolineae bacterium]
MPDLSLPALPATGRRVTPTDVAQFIRLDQCERYLRLQLASRHGGQRFLRDYDVAPQAIPPLLTQVGRTFEKDVEAAIAAAYPSLNLAQAATVGARRAADNAAVVDVVRALAAGEARVLFQPRLAVGLGDWQVTGDIDILRLDRVAAGLLRVLISD